MKRDDENYPIRVKRVQNIKQLHFGAKLISFRTDDQPPVRKDHLEELL